jgi:hypothetical protein
VTNRNQPTSTRRIDILAAHSSAGSAYMLTSLAAAAFLLTAGPLLFGCMLEAPYLHTGSDLDSALLLLSAVSL